MFWVILKSVPRKNVAAIQAQFQQPNNRSSNWKMRTQTQSSNSNGLNNNKSWKVKLPSNSGSMKRNSMPILPSQQIASCLNNWTSFLTFVLLVSTAEKSKTLQQLEPQLQQNSKHFSRLTTEFEREKSLLYASGNGAATISKF